MKFTNNNHTNAGRNNRKRQKYQGQTRDIIYVVSRYLFTYQDLSGWWVDSKDTRHIAKSKEGSVEMKDLRTED